ncbi:MAG: chemotaxis protein CheW [Desulfobacterales bacterium]|nr:chemotaxis protein CheW [Desulfobacterales bacterium]
MTDPSGKKEIVLEQYCTFWIAERLFGVNIKDVNEITEEFKITPIYHAPKEILGYVNIRGQIYLVIDTRVVLRFDQKSPDEKSRIILFKQSVGEYFGIMVDCIDGVVNINERDIENRRKRDTGSPDGNEKRVSIKNLEKGVCRMENFLMVALNAGSFLGSIKLN